MHDAFSRAAPPTAHHRRSRGSSKGYRFSPSYGVHKGLIPDPDWPPPEFPAQGSATLRRSRRIACELEVTIDGTSRKLRGDLSYGGAMFLMPFGARTVEAVVTVKGVSARGQVLTRTIRGEEIAHHVRFDDPAEGRKIWQALVQ